MHFQLDLVSVRASMKAILPKEYNLSYCLVINEASTLSYLCLLFQKYNK